VSKALSSLAPKEKKKKSFSSIAKSTKTKTTKNLEEHVAQSMKEAKLGILAKLCPNHLLGKTDG
jgi:hypothetical protein